MNTYQVTYYAPGATTPSTMTVQAADYTYEPDVVVFLDANRDSVLSVPLALLPIVERTATA